MKKLIYLTLGLIAVLSAGSCQKEINYLDGETNVRFQLTAGEIDTKAVIADGTNIDVLFERIRPPK